jgi:hypothetical protein
MDRGLPVGLSVSEAATDGGAEEFIDGGGTPVAAAISYSNGVQGE